MSEACRIGFVGVGKIAQAIVTGLCTGSQASSIKSLYLSPRSQEISAALASKFPTVVKVAPDNQSVVDNCDILFLCVLPKQLDEVLASLKLRPEMTLVSLVSTSKLPALVSLSGLKETQVFKMICLPPVETHQGVCLMIPKGKSTRLLALFDSLGGTVECESETIMQAMMAPTCMMAPFYAVLANQRDWLVRQGVPASDASMFVGRTIFGLAQKAETNCKDPKYYDELVADNTPGGLNLQSLDNLNALGVFRAYDQIQDLIFERVRGQGDGSLNGSLKDALPTIGALLVGFVAGVACMKFRSNVA